MYFLLNLSHYVKSYGHLCQILAFSYNARSPNMAMSRDPRSNFQKNLLFLILHLILDKAAKFLAEKLSTSEVISQKPHGGWKTAPPLPSAFRVKRTQGHINFHTLVSHSFNFHSNRCTDFQKHWII